MKRIQLLSPSLFVSLVSAFADNLNPKGTGCVDPSGYLQCYQDNIDAATKCVEDAKATCGASVNTCLVACGNVQLAANLGCWLTSCWNQVCFFYSLESNRECVGLEGENVCSKKDEMMMG